MTDDAIVACVINVFDRGVVAVILAFVLFGVTSMPDGPFLRPHPGTLL